MAVYRIAFTKLQDTMIHPDTGRPFQIYADRSGWTWTLYLDTSRIHRNADRDDPSSSLGPPEEFI